MENKLSVRGRLARKVVEIANHIAPVDDSGSKSELREKLFARDWKCPEQLQLIDMDMGQFHMELLKERKREELYNDRGIILQLHGGGYYSDINNSYRDMAVQYFEVSGGMDILTIDYQVAPEYPYPAALEDAIKAYQWILAQGYENDNIVVVGDSAGGGLALALGLYLRDNNILLPQKIITMSAWADLTCRGESYEKNFDIDPVFGGTKDSVVFHNAYYRDNNPENPYISPVFGDYDGFPPMLLQVGEHEMLLSDTTTIAKKAEAVNVDVTLHIYPGMFHIFQKGLGMYPESQEAWEEIRSFLHEKGKEYV